MTREGDLNNDGQVNVLDIQLCVNVFLGLATNARADINGDIQKIVNKISGG